MTNPMHRHQHVPYDFLLKEGSSDSPDVPAPVFISMEARTDKQLSILSAGSLAFRFRNDVPFEKAKEIQQMLNSMIMHVSYNEHLETDPWFGANDLPTNPIES